MISTSSGYVRTGSLSGTFIRTSRAFIPFFTTSFTSTDTETEDSISSRIAFLSAPRSRAHPRIMSPAAPEKGLKISAFIRLLPALRFQFILCYSSCSAFTSFSLFPAAAIMFAIRAAYAPATKPASIFTTAIVEQDCSIASRAAFPPPPAP